jgi:Flp pilus assembly protein TadB
VAKRRRAKTRRQRQIRRKQQLQREAAARRQDEPDRPLQSEQRKARKDAHKGKRSDLTQGLTWRFALALVVMLYGLVVWGVRITSPQTVEGNPTLWIALLVVLACGVGACLGAGLSVTVRRKQWRWVIPMAIPIITVPTLYAYCYFTLRAARKGIGAKFVPPDTSRKTAGSTPSSGRSEDIKLLGD